MVEKLKEVTLNANIDWNQIIEDSNEGSQRLISITKDYWPNLPIGAINEENNNVDIYNYNKIIYHIKYQHAW